MGSIHQTHCLIQLEGSIGSLLQPHSLVQLEGSIEKHSSNFGTFRPNQKHLDWRTHALILAWTVKRTSFCCIVSAMCHRTASRHPIPFGQQTWLARVGVLVSELLLPRKIMQTSG